MASRIVVLALLIASGLQQPRPRDPATALQGSARITGRVVDAATNAPLSGARVRLSGSAPRGPVLTDRAGAFVFAELPGGTYSFVVERNGYLSASWPESSRWVRRQEARITLAATDTLENVTLPLDRGGVVAGKVISPTGEPISGAQVSLVGVVPPIYTRNGTTNDLGDYRVAELPPGRYVLRAHPRPSSNNPPDTPLSGPLPTYYPRTRERSQAQELVVGGGGEVTEANIQLGEGTLSLLDVTVTYTDGRSPDYATLAVSTVTHPPMVGFGNGSIRNGLGRLELPPGEYTLRAAASSGLQNTKDRTVFDLVGITRVRLASGTRAAVTVVVGMSATASGSIVFEGEGSSPTPALASGRVPMFAPEWETCRFGTPTVAADWTFKIDGLAGTCRSSPRQAPLSAGWGLKSVMLDGREVLDDNVWFEPGRHYENVRIVMTDRRSQVRVRVTEADGTPTGEYAAVAFPVQRERWRSPDRYISAAAPLPPSFLGKPDPSGTGGEPGRSLRLIGLPAGDYYLIAVDDIEFTATRDPAVLEMLARHATRVTIPERDLLEVPLQRHLLSDLLR